MEAGHSLNSIETMDVREYLEILDYREKKERIKTDKNLDSLGF